MTGDGSNQPGAPPIRFSCQEPPLTHTHNTSLNGSAEDYGCRSIRTKALSSNTSSAQCSEAPLRSQSGGGPKL